MPSGADSHKNKRSIASLKKENKILRGEIKRLSRRLRSYSAAASAYPQNKKELPSIKKAFGYAYKNAILMASSSYIRYAWSKLTGASLYSLWKRISGYFRKFRLVSTVIRTLSSFIAIIGTGAFFIFISGTLIFFLPIATLACSATYIISMFLRKKAFIKLEQTLKNKNIYVFFPQNGRPFEEVSCFKNTLKLIDNTHNDNFIIIVSPYFISSKGFGGSGYYFVFRQETKSVCIMRKHSFFAFRKKVLGGMDKKTTYIY